MKILRPITTLLALATLAALAVLSAASAQSGPATTFTDKRDGKTYRTAVIGKQRWMAENLNYQTGKSVCYENKESNCQKYGRLYDWDDAMNVCPDGWRLPDTIDWNVLVYAAGDIDAAGKNLKSKTGWQNDGSGTDAIGFSALPGGGRSDGGSFILLGKHGSWWSTSECGRGSSDCAIYRDILHGDDYLYEGRAGRSVRLSVRCLKDTWASR